MHGFWWRVVGFHFLVALALVAAGFTLLIRRGDTSWLMGVLGSVLILGVGFLVGLYVVHCRLAAYQQYSARSFLPGRKLQEAKLADNRLKAGVCAAA